MPFGSTTLSETLDTVYSTTWQNFFRDDVANTVFNATTFWKQMQAKGIRRESGGGRWIGFQLEVNKNETVAFIGKGGTISLADTDPLRTGKVDWKYLTGNVTRFFVDDQQNKSKAQIRNLLQGKVNNLKRSLQDKLETALFGDGSGDSGLAIDGLGNIVDDTATYAGFAPATYTFWKSKLTASTGAAAVYLRSDMTTVYNNVRQIDVPSNKPTLIMTDQASYELYEMEVVAPLQQIVNLGSNGSADVGTGGLNFKGVPIEWSPAATPAGVMWFLNTNFFEAVIDSAIEMDMTEWKPIPNQLDRVAQVVTALNVVCVNRKSQGKLTAIAA